MKLEIPDAYLPLIVTALENQYSYTRAVQRDDGRYQEAAGFFRARLLKEPEEK